MVLDTITLVAIVFYISILLSIIAILIFVYSKNKNIRKVTEIILKLVGSFLVGSELALWLKQDNFIHIIIFTLGLTLLIINYKQN